MNLRKTIKERCVNCLFFDKNVSNLAFLLTNYCKNTILVIKMIAWVFGGAGVGGKGSPNIIGTGKNGFSV